MFIQEASFLNVGVLVHSSFEKLEDREYDIRYNSHVLGGEHALLCRTLVSFEGCKMNADIYRKLWKDPFAVDNLQHSVAARPSFSMDGK